MPCRHYHDRIIGPLENVLVSKVSYIEVYLLVRAKQFGNLA